MSEDRQRRVIITGISGALGGALGQLYRERGCHVVGVSRREGVEGLGDRFDELAVNAQQDQDDANALLDLDPDLVILSAGAIETAVDDNGMPLVEQLLAMTKVNYEFPALLAIEAVKRTWDHRIDLIGVGSIADGQPSCFGPMYHATKKALHYFVTGVGPIAKHANPQVHLRLYRPGVIHGKLSWAPVIRLGDNKAKAMRAKRCEAAPPASKIAAKVARFIDGKKWVRGDWEPLSFQFLKLFHSLLPHTYVRLQDYAWKKFSKYPPGGTASSTTGEAGGGPAEESSTP